MLLSGYDPQPLEVFISFWIYHQQPGLILPGLDSGNNFSMAQPLHILPIHLNEPVLGTEARVRSRRARVHRADVLTRAGLVTMQVEPIALGSLLQVAEPGTQLSWGPIDILMASVRAKAARACPVVLWFPGVVDWWEASMGHLLGTGQLPPAELLICLLVHHEQSSLPLYSLDPLYHLVMRLALYVDAVDLNQAVPGAQRGGLGWGAWLHAPDELTAAALLAMQVEAVSLFAAYQAT